LCTNIFALIYKLFLNYPFFFQSKVVVWFSSPFSFCTHMWFCCLLGRLEEFIVVLFQQFQGFLYLNLVLTLFVFCVGVVVHFYTHHSSLIIDVMFIVFAVLGLRFKDQDISEVQPMQEVLVGSTATSEHEVFHIYNDYAYKVAFSVRYSKIRHRCKFKGGGLCMR